MDGGGALGFDDAAAAVRLPGGEVWFLGSGKRRVGNFEEFRGRGN